MQHYLCGAELGCLSSCIKKKCIKEKRWLTSASGSWAAACGSRLQIWQLVRVCDQVVGTIGAGWGEEITKVSEAGLPVSFSSTEVVIGPVSGTRRLLLSTRSQQQRVKALAAPSLRAGAALRFPTSGEGVSQIHTRFFRARASTGVCSEGSCGCAAFATSVLMFVPTKKQGYFAVFHTSSTLSS